jgi:predicted enzyme related to lactoylglutathione lyase
MRKHVFLIVAIASAFTLGWTLRPVPERNKTPRITGIGGVFFQCNEPAKLKEWYAKHFGLKIDQYGAVFEFRNTDAPEEINYLSWSPFGKKSTYFKPGNKNFMVNYRVEGLWQLLKELRASGTTIMDSSSYDYGDFAHVLDPDSTLIELWEPRDSVFTRLYSRSTTH